MKTKIETCIRVSQIYERTSKSKGSNILGFTVWTSDSKFSNHVECFGPTNRLEVLKQMMSLRESYLQQIDIDDKQTININNKGD